MLRALTATVLLAGVAFGAHAAPLDENITRIDVTFLNSELTDPAKIDATYTRLHQVAQRACWSEGAGLAARVADDKVCEDQAMDEAVADLGSPELTRRHHQEGRAPQVASADKAEH